MRRVSSRQPRTKSLCPRAHGLARVRIPGRCRIPRARSCSVRSCPAQRWLLGRACPARRINSIRCRRRSTLERWSAGCRRTTPRWQRRPGISPITSARFLLWPTIVRARRSPKATARRGCATCSTALIQRTRNSRSLEWARSVRGERGRQRPGATLRARVPQSRCALTRHRVRRMRGHPAGRDRGPGSRGGSDRTQRGACNRAPRRGVQPRRA